jgi:parallel beta-helix repeat protein
VQDATATIEWNTIDNYQKEGILVRAIGGPTSATVVFNTVTGIGPTTVNGQNGIQVSDGANAKVDFNSVSGNVYTPQSYIGTGIILVNPGQVEVGYNKVTGNDVGIVLQDTANAVVDHNWVSKSTFDGIALRGATTGAQITDNVSGDNHEDGLFVEPTATNNKVSHNIFYKNGSYDIEDQSHGSGTAGTANYYSSNYGKTSSPPGLVASR